MLEKFTKGVSEKHFDKIIPGRTGHDLDLVCMGLHTRNPTVKFLENRWVYKVKIDERPLGNVDIDSFCENLNIQNWNENIQNTNYGEISKPA